MCSIAGHEQRPTRAALPKLGFDDVTSVRQGKRFELEIAQEANAADAADRVMRIAATLLANPVIEDFTVRVGD